MSEIRRLCVTNGPLRFLLCVSVGGHPRDEVKYWIKEKKLSKKFREVELTKNALGFHVGMEEYANNFVWVNTQGSGKAECLKGILVHELDHAVRHSLTALSIEDVNGEMPALLMQWLYEETIGLIDGKEESDQRSRKSICLCKRCKD